MLLEFQRIIVDLYSSNEKYINIITTDTKVDEKNLAWKAENCIYRHFSKIIENIKVMEDVDEKYMEDSLYKNIDQCISLIGKITPSQKKFIELFYSNKNNLLDGKKNHRWWDLEFENILNDKNDRNFDFFNNLGMIILIVHNFNDEDVKNTFKHISSSFLEHKVNVHGCDRLKNIHLKIINVVDKEEPLFKKYCEEDLKSNIRLERYDIHLNENSKSTIGFVLREIFNLSSFTMTNIPMKDESNLKLNINVEMYHPKVDLPFLNIKKFQDNLSSIASCTAEYECVNMSSNIKLTKNLTTITAAWNSTPKRVPLLLQSLPFTVSDFSSREGSCANGFILGGKDIFPDILLKDSSVKGSELAFSLSKNIDNLKGQICIIDEALYESKSANEKGGQNLADKKIVDKMVNFIDSCTSNIEITDSPGLMIDNDLKNERIVNPLDGMMCSMESNDCFRSELNKITKILSRTDSIDSTYPYLKAIIESKERSNDEMKCILDVVSNFKYISKYHRNLYEGFCYYYFNKYITLGEKMKSRKFSSYKNIRNVTVKPTNKNVIERFLEFKEDNRPEFAGWCNNKNDVKLIVPLYQNLNKLELEEKQPYQSKYVAPDHDEDLLAEYSMHIQPLSDDYLKVAPPPYFGGCIIPAAFEKQRMEYRNYVNLLTNGSLSKEMKIEIERKCEKLRINYSEPLPPLVSSSVHQFDCRKRRLNGEFSSRTKKLYRYYIAPPRTVVNLTKQEAQLAEKLSKEYRESLKGKLIDVNAYKEKIREIEEMNE
uniref:Protein asunder n=1 Tax=Strongyloides papillosus TaxID=174720 RepID=A0A0N5BCG6_STREA